MITRIKKADVRQLAHSLTTDYSFILSFISLLIVATAVNPRFFGWNNITNLFAQGTIIGIIAMGMSMVISAGMIDISVGAQVALISGLGVEVLNIAAIHYGAAGGILIMLAFCCALGLIIGAFNGVLVTYGCMPAMIATLAMQSVCRSIINHLGQGGPFSVDASSAHYEPFRLINAGGFFVFGARIPYFLVVFIIITIIFSVVMTRTKLGKHIYAVGSNETSARLSGVNIHKIKITVFAITGMTCGIAAFLYASRLTAIQPTNAGLNFEMDSIAAVAIGGTAMSGGRGKIIGTFLGVIMFRIITNTLSAANIPTFLNGLVSGLIIIVAVVVQNLSRKNRAR